MGFGASGPIPWDRMDRYAQRHQLEEDNALAFIQVMVAMDQVFMEDQISEADKKRKETEKPDKKR